MLRKTIAKLGLVTPMLAVALSSGTDRGLKTRTHEMLNRPISVKNGVVDSGAFEIEREETILSSTVTANTNADRRPE